MVNEPCQLQQSCSGGKWVGMANAPYKQKMSPGGKKRPRQKKRDPGSKKETRRQKEALQTLELIDSGYWYYMKPGSKGDMATQETWRPRSPNSK